MIGKIEIWAIRIKNRGMFMTEFKHNLKRELLNKKGISKEEFTNMTLDLFQSMNSNPLSLEAFELAMSLLYKKYKLGETGRKM